MEMKTTNCLLGLSFPCLLLLVIFPCATSLSFNYNFSVPGVLAAADLQYLNNSAAGKDRIELTNISRWWSTGRVAHRQPVRLWDGNNKIASFTSSFTFAIKPNDNQPQGDGMAFFVTRYNHKNVTDPVEMPQDARGGFLALFNNRENKANDFPPTVGVEFDTNWNDWDPPGTVDHMGIDVNDIKSMEYGKLPNGSLNGIMSASVRYDAKAATLSATLWFVDPPRQGPVIVSANVDLREAGLPQDAAVGFSAATGNSSELHQILAWSFESTMTDITTKNIGLIAGLASGGVFILLAIAAWLGYLQYHKRKGRQEDAEIPLDQDMDKEFEMGGPRKFSYNELSRATQGFSDKEKLGGGGFGAVYRGFLQEQVLHVAIKKVSETSRQGRREYIAEVTIFGRLRHRNLVNLVGWCHKSDEFLLVYELMENRSLDVHLYNSKEVLAWPTRYKIVLGMGSALFYLHQECEQCVLHRDIKPSNVMLDSSFNAKLGDFGLLARLVDHSRGGFTTAQVAGTRGYMDPEYVYSGRATTESDVYSFGVVLLEIACGRRPVVEQKDESKVVLVEWVWALHWRKMLLDAVDARLNGSFDAQEMERVLVVGLWCVHPDYGFRPSIRHALNVLQCEAPLPDLPPEMPVATYARRPHVVHGWSSYTSSSTGTGSSATTGGRSSKSDQMIGSARSHSFATAADAGGATRPSATATDHTDTTRSTGEHSGNR